MTQGRQRAARPGPRIRATIGQGVAAPSDTANRYPVINDWQRAFPWTPSKRRDHLETVYRRIVGAHGSGEPLEQSVRVYLHRSVMWDMPAATWSITEQIRKSLGEARHRQAIRGGYRR